MDTCSHQHYQDHTHKNVVLHHSLTAANLNHTDQWSYHYQRSHHVIAIQQRSWDNRSEWVMQVSGKWRTIWRTRSLPFSTNVTDSLNMGSQWPLAIDLVRILWCDDGSNHNSAYGLIWPIRSKFLLITPVRPPRMADVVWHIPAVATLYNAQPRNTIITRQRTHEWWHASVKVFFCLFTFDG